MGDISALLGGIGQVPIRGGAAPLPGGDHWAPKYLIGNVTAGDPAVPQAGAFRYIPEPMARWIARKSGEFFEPGREMPQYGRLKDDSQPA